MNNAKDKYIKKILKKDKYIKRILQKDIIISQEVNNVFEDFKKICIINNGRFKC